jgi:hypothetical protein
VPKIISAIKKISQKVTRKHSKKEKRKESNVEKTSADVISQMKGVTEMLIQSSTESTSFDVADGQSEKTKMPKKSSSMDEKSSKTTDQSVLNEEKQRSSSIVGAISEMKDVTETLIQSSTDNSKTLHHLKSESQNQQTNESPNEDAKKMENSAMQLPNIDDQGKMNSKDQQISEELITLQKTKQDQIVTITSQLDNIVDPHVIDLLQQGLRQITSEDVDS